MTKLNYTAYGRKLPQSPGLGLCTPGEDLGPELITTLQVARRTVPHSVKSSDSQALAVLVGEEYWRQLILHREKGGVGRRP